MKSRHSGDVHASGAAQNLPPRTPAGHAQRRRRAPGRPREGVDQKRDGGQHADDGRQGVAHGDPEQPRAPGHRAAEEVGRPRPQRAAGRHRVGPVAPVLRPADGLRPLRLQVRPGGTVEERRLELAPAALERDPGEVGPGLGRVARDDLVRRPGDQAGISSVVAPDALRARRAEVQRRSVEVGVRAVGRVDDRVRPVHALELRVVPRRSLAALVLAVADLARGHVQRLGGRRRGEVDLDHLPVALVEVVPVVVDVEHPVLERDLPRVAGVGHDVRVHRRLVTLVDVPRPVQVVAARVERVAREVEVILVEPGPEVAGARPDLHEVGARPRPAQRDRRLVEEQIDVDRDVRLPGAASLGLIDEPHDGGVARRERRLVRRRRGGGRRRGHPRGGEDGGEHGDSGPRRHRAAPPSLGVLTSPQSARLIWVMAGSPPGSAGVDHVAAT